MLRLRHIGCGSRIVCRGAIEGSTRGRGRRGLARPPLELEVGEVCPSEKWRGCVSGHPAPASAICLALAPRWLHGIVERVGHQARKALAGRHPPGQIVVRGRLYEYAEHVVACEQSRGKPTARRAIGEHLFTRASRMFRPASGPVRAPVTTKRIAASGPS
jgi:hypothetical protein